MRKTKEQRKRVRELVAERLLWLQERHRKLTPALVVADAKRPDSPLHRHGGFQWDIHKASYRHWLDRARALIATVTIIYHVDHREISVPYYHRDPRLDNKTQGYCTIVQLRDDRALAIQSIDDQLVSALGCLHRVLNTARVLGLEDRVMEAISSLRDLRRRVRQTPRKRATAVRHRVQAKSRRAS